MNNQIMIRIQTFHKIKRIINKNMKNIKFLNTSLLNNQMVALPLTIQTILRSNRNAMLQFESSHWELEQARLFTRMRSMATKDFISMILKLEL